MRRVIIGSCLVLAGCRQQGPPPEAELSLRPAAEAGAVDESGCDGSMSQADVTSIDGRYRLVMGTVDAVRSGRCDPIARSDRLCRALFLIEVTDPLVGLGLGMDAALMDELVDRHAWSLAEGIAAADANGNSPLAAALADLSALELADALAAGLDHVAALAARRGDPLIIEPIAEAEEHCHVG